MAGTDNIVFNTRERPLSTDWNNLEAMLGRTLMDLERYRNMLRTMGYPSSEAVRNIVAGGLQVTPSGSDVSVSAGVLLQDSATLAPVPGALDSSYRIGINRAATTVVMPAPGVTTYYLVEAQMTEVTTSTENRDILDSGTGIFVPTAVPKQRERRIQFQLLTGGADAPAPSGGNWVPVAIVRRPGGGGAVVASDIIDVRRLPDARELPTLPVPDRVQLHVAAGGAATTSAAVRAVIDGGLGRRCYDLFSGTVDLDSTTIKSPATTYAAGTRYYLYLAPWSSLSLTPRYTDGVVFQEGVLVMSHLAPNALKLNASALSLPAPYGVVNAPALSAYYVGTFLRDSGNTGWVGMSNVNGDVRFEITAMVSSPFRTNLSPPASGDNAFGTFVAPATARRVLIRLIFAGGAVAIGTAVVIGAQYSASAISLDTAAVDDALTSYHTLDIPYDGSSTVQINLNSAVNAGTTLGLAVVGWKE